MARGDGKKLILVLNCGSPSIKFAALNPEAKVTIIIRLNPKNWFCRSNH
jgi:acetate kinase